MRPEADRGEPQPIRVRGLRLSYRDFGGPGQPVLALHGHFGRAASFAAVASALAPQFRLIALEQRAHGVSDDDGDHSRTAYVADAAEFLRWLDLGSLPVLGHSMGGVTAYQLAARHPDLVSALVVEEAGAVVGESILDVTDWPQRTDTLDQLRAAIEARGIPDATYFLASAREYADGWGLMFEPAAMLDSQRELIGDWWADWLGSTCPALLLHGHDSVVVTTALAREMAERRPGTELVEFPHCGHFLHDEDRTGFAAAARGFLLRAGATGGRHG